MDDNKIDRWWNAFDVTYGVVDSDVCSIMIDMLAQLEELANEVERLRDLEEAVRFHVQNRTPNPYPALAAELQFEDKPSGVKEHT